MKDDLDQRQPRVRNSPYMGKIARLPCVGCLVEGGFYNYEVQVAHLRAGSLEHEKRSTGMQERPSDVWTLPLCQPHHLGDRRWTALSQHKMGELEFWEALSIDPFQLCKDLAAAYEAGRDMRPVLIIAVGKARKARAEHG